MCLIVQSASVLVLVIVAHLATGENVDVTELFHPFSVDETCIDWLQFHHQEPAEPAFAANCCSALATTFRALHRVKLRHLSQYLRYLKLANCTEFQEECVTRLYQYTPFSTLMYDVFCDTTAVVNTCFQGLNNTFASNLVSYIQYQLISDLSLNASCDCNKTAAEAVIQVRRQSGDSIRDPCTQMTMLLSVNSSDRFEIVIGDVPFCDIVWCAFNTDTLQRYRISGWTCLPNRCKAGAGIFLAIFIILSICITFSNIKTILVIESAPSLRHSQTLFKEGLAIGDCMVGVIVLPTMFNSFYLLVLGEFVVNTNTSSAGGPTLEMRSVVSQEYLSGVGFFTALAIFLSLHMLTLAAIDRLIAVTFPFKYDKARALRFAKKSVITCWLVALIAASLPLYTPTLKYAKLIAVYVLIDGQASHYLYLLLLCLPLLFMWGATLATYIVVVRSTRKTQKVLQRPQSRNLEQRLAKTLTLMVATYTVCILPAAVIVGLGLSEPPIDHRKVFMHRDAQFLSVLLLLSNSLWNHFIYNMRDKEYRKSIREIFPFLAFGKRCNCSKRTEHKSSAETRSDKSSQVNPISINISGSRVTDETRAPDITDGNDVEQLDTGLFTDFGRSIRTSRFFRSVMVKVDQRVLEMSVTQETQI